MEGGSGREGRKEVEGGKEGGGRRVSEVGENGGRRKARPGSRKNEGRGQWKKLVTSLFCVVFPNGSTENCGTVSGTIPVKIQGKCVFDCDCLR